MKRVYALLFNLSIISTHSVAKPTKIDSKYETDKQKQTIIKKKTLSKAKIVKYKIENGDTLFTIARKHHTTVAEVKSTNHLAQDEILKVGRSLQVPLNTYFPKEMNIQSTLKMIQEQTVKKKRLARKNPTYTIQQGDTLLAIALSHDTTLTTVEKLNGFDSNKTLKLGEVIKLPQDVKKSSDTSSKIETTKLAKVEKKHPKKESKTKKIATKGYTIKRGDTLLAIALSHDTTLTTVEKLNSFDSNKTLKLGEVISVPKTSKKMKKRITFTKKIKSKKVKNHKKTLLAHTIKKGDTLNKIAQKYDITVAKLIKINKLNPRKSLKIGAKLSLVTKPKAKIKKSKRLASKKRINKRVKNKKIASAKVHKKRVKRKNRTRRFVVTTKPTKKSFIEMLGWGSSSLKLAAAKKQLGKRYVWGATGPYTFDCSGFTKYVCDKNGVCIPRTSINQSKVGKKVTRRQLKAGDLIFFDTSRRRRGYVNHVGIYIGHNKFIHASSAKRKVVITSLNAPFYKARFKWGRRVKG